jgi:galactoside O-acetyltransferase
MILYNIPNVDIGSMAMVCDLENISFGKYNVIDDFVYICLGKGMKIGNNVHISAFSTITGGEYCTLGDFSTISVGSHILTGSDDFVGWGFGNPTTSMRFRNVKRAPVFIGKFARIGANSIIMPGVTIGVGSTVGANSVVTKDLEPWGVYLGNKRIKNRDKEGVLKKYDEYLEFMSKK